MKKVVVTIILLSMLLSLFGCTTNKLNIPKYIKKECYYSDGLQDYTDYCKYFYNEESIRAFEKNSFFVIVENSNIENIKSYFKHFTECVKEQSFYDEYDFNYEVQIKEGDYFYIITKEGMDIGDGIYGQFDYYDVYYVDMDKKILYFIHSNS